MTPTVEDLSVDLREALELAKNEGRRLITGPDAAIQAWALPEFGKGWKIAEVACRRAIAAEEEVERLREENASLRGIVVGTTGPDR